MRMLFCVFSLAALTFAAPLIAAPMFAAAPPAAAAESLAEVFKRVKDAVVTIHVQDQAAPGDSAGNTASDEGVGSGVVTDIDGLVLTAAHLVQVAARIEVEFASGERIPARVISSEPLADIALLKLERAPQRAVTAHPADSDTVEVGDEVFVVGAPFGMTHSLSVGHIGGRRNANVLFGGLAPAELLQTDAAINTGNSGGPMFNRNGEIVGIVSSILTRSGGFEGIGFAVASNTARRLWTERPAWTGMDGFLVTGPLAEILNLPQAAGLLVQRIAKDSPADRMGLRAGRFAAVIDDEDLLVGGDVILQIDGVRLSDSNAGEKVRAVLRGRPAGTRVPVIVLRGGRLIELEYQLP